MDSLYRFDIIFSTKNTEFFRVKIKKSELQSRDQVSKSRATLDHSSEHAPWSPFMGLVRGTAPLLD